MNYNSLITLFFFLSMIPWALLYSLLFNIDTKKKSNIQVFLLVVQCLAFIMYVYLNETK